MKKKGNLRFTKENAIELLEGEALKVAHREKKRLGKRRGGLV